MATEIVNNIPSPVHCPEQTKSDNKYHTRYGLMTAPQAANDLLERSWSRLRFLEEVFAVVHHDGDGFEMGGYSSCGLSAILKDIAHDVYTAQAYHEGGDPEPGKEG